MLSAVFALYTLALLLVSTGCSRDDVISSPSPAATKASELAVLRTVVTEPTADPPKVVTVAPEIAQILAPSYDDAPEISATSNEPGEVLEPESHETLEPADLEETASIEIEAVPLTMSEDIEWESGTLRVPFNGGLIPDPAFDDGIGANRPLLGEIFSGLTRLEPSSGTPELDLTETFTVDDDGMGYEFVLRKGIRFSDGHPVTAADFKWSWERALDPAYSNGNAIRVFGGVDGAASIISGDSADLRGVVVVDDITLRIELASPRYDLLYLLADPIASVLRRGNVDNWIMDWRDVLSGTLYEEGHQFGEELPTGTGPFKLAEFDLYKDVLVLHRNEYYWDAPAHVDRIEYVSPITYSDGEVPTDHSILFEYQVIDLLPIPPEFADVNTEVEVRAFEVPPTVEFLAFNSGLEPYRDLGFRRALVNASTVPHLIPEGGLSMNGSRLTVASSLLPPEFPGHAQEAFEVASEIPQASISANGTVSDLTFHTYVGGSAIEEFQTLAASWPELLGVEIDVKVVTLDEFNAWLRNGDIEIRRVSVTPHYADPSAILNVMNGLFGDRDDSPEAQEITRRLNEVLHQADAAVRYAHFHDLEHYLLDNALVLPLFWTESRKWVRVQPWIVEYMPPKYHGSRFKSVRIDVSHPDYPYDER